MNTCSSDVDSLSSTLNMTPLLVLCSSQGLSQVRKGFHPQAVHILELLISHSASYTCTDANKRSCIHHMCMNGPWFDGLQWLLNHIERLEEKASVVEMSSGGSLAEMLNAADCFGMTPLHYAVQMHDKSSDGLECVKLLCRYGAYVIGGSVACSITTNQSWHVLHAACGTCSAFNQSVLNSGIIDFLLEQGKQSC